MFSQNVGEFNALLDIVKYWAKKTFPFFVFKSYRVKTKSPRANFKPSATQKFLSACTESLAACLIEHFDALKSRLLSSCLGLFSREERYVDT